jgi:hypothetical protein
MLIRDGDSVGMTSPIDWPEIVKGTWSKTVDRRELTVQVVQAIDSAPLAGAEVRLIPRASTLMFPKLAIEPFESNLDLAQAKFRVLDGTDWSASVRLPESKNWVPHTIAIEDGDIVRVVIDTDQKVRLLARDYFGAPAPGVELALSSRGSELIRAKTDEEGRAEMQVQADTEYFVEVKSHEWFHANRQEQHKVKASALVRELRLKRRYGYEYSYSAVGFEKPGRITVHLYGEDLNDPKGQTSCYENLNSIGIMDDVRLLVVDEPGCVIEHLPIDPSTKGAGPPIQIELRRGPTVVVARAVLPADYIAPLKATAQAIKIDKIPLWEGAAQERAMKRYSSEFTPTEGDIVFGPLSPGKYALKILDANGKTLWEETREVK